jgi:hypothetical protein
MEETEQAIDWRRPVIGDFIWDMFPHQLEANDYRRIQDDLGLIPSDDDGLNVLYDEAEKRKAIMKPIQGKVDLMSGWAAEVVVEYAFQSAKVDMNQLPQQIRDAFNTQNTNVIQMAVTAILGNLLDTGVLAYGEKLKAN